MADEAPRAPAPPAPAEPEQPASSAAAPAPPPAPPIKWLVTGRMKFQSLVLPALIISCFIALFPWMFSKLSYTFITQLGWGYAFVFPIGMFLNIGTGMLSGLPEAQQDHIMQTHLVAGLSAVCGSAAWNKFVTLAAMIGELKAAPEAARRMAIDEMCPQAFFSYQVAGVFLFVSSIGLASPCWATTRNRRVFYTGLILCLGIMSIGHQMSDKTQLLHVGTAPNGLSVNVPLWRAYRQPSLQLALTLDPKTAKKPEQVNLVRTHCSIVSHPMCDTPAKESSAPAYEARVRAFLHEESWRLVAGYLRDTAATDAVIGPLVNAVRQQLLRDPEPSASRATPAPAASPPAQPLSAEL